MPCDKIVGPIRYKLPFAGARRANFSFPAVHATMHAAPGSNLGEETVTFLPSSYPPFASMDQRSGFVHVGQYPM